MASEELEENGIWELCEGGFGQFCNDLFILKMSETCTFSPGPPELATSPGIAGWGGGGLRMLLRPNSLCLPHDRPMNQGAETRNMPLIRKPADREDGRLMSQNNHLSGSGCQLLL